MGVVRVVRVHGLGSYQLITQVAVKRRMTGEDVLGVVSFVKDAHNFSFVHLDLISA